MSLTYNLSHPTLERKKLTLKHVTLSIQYTFDSLLLYSLKISSHNAPMQDQVNKKFIGEGTEYRPFRDLRSVVEAGRPREQLENHGKACTQVHFLSKAELGFFHFLEIMTCWLIPSAGQKIQVQHMAGTFHRRKSCLLKTGFFSQGREMKVQRKNRGSALGLCSSMLHHQTEGRKRFFTIFCFSSKI